MEIRRVQEPSDVDWLVPLAAITALEVGLARSLGLAGTYFFLAFGLAAVFALGLLCRSLVAMMRRGEEHPISALLSSIEWTRLGFAIAGILIASLSFSALEVLKSDISLVIPFYADRYLAALDYFIFGEDAWRFFDRALYWLAGPMGVFYGLWILGQMGTFTAVILSPPSIRKTRALVTYALMWFLVGTVLAYLLSSVGPLFFDQVYGGSRFAGLQRILSHTAFQADVAHSLWRSHQTGTLMVGSGISAMPSMHLAGATWLALLVRAWFPRFAVLGWIYVAVIYVGSVMLGWHYASDGVIGIVGTLLCWRVAPVFSSALSLSSPSLKLASLWG